MVKIEHNLGTIIETHLSGIKELALPAPSYLPLRAIYVSSGSPKSQETAKSLMAAGVRLAILPESKLGNLPSRKQIERLNSADVVFVEQEYADRVSYLPKERIVMVVGKVDHSTDKFVQLARNLLPLSKSQRERKYLERISSPDFDWSDPANMFARLEERTEEQKMGTDVMDATSFKTIYEERYYGGRKRRDLFSFSFLEDNKESLLKPVFGEYLGKRPLKLLEDILRAPSTDLVAINDRLNLIDSFAALGPEQNHNISKKMNAIADLSEVIKALSQATSFMLQCYRGRLGGDMSTVYRDCGLNIELPYEFDPSEPYAIAIREENYHRFMKAAHTILEQTDAIIENVPIPELGSITLQGYRLGIEHALNPNNNKGIIALLEKLKQITRAEPKNSAELLSIMNFRDEINRYTGCCAFLMEAANQLAMYTGVTAFFIENKWTRPLVLAREEKKIEIKNGWNPLLQKEQKVPNDTYLNGNTQVEITEGANAAGKTVYLLQVPLIVNFAQAGLYIPAESASVSVHERIFVRLKKTGTIRDNQSGYVAELNDTKDMLSKISDHENYSLVCLDEWLTSTRFDDGEAVLCGLIEGEFIPKHVRAIVSTHFPHLAHLRSIPGVVTSYFPVENRGDNLIYTYKKMESTTDIDRPHYGLAVAMAAGLPPKVLDIARARLGKL